MAKEPLEQVGEAIVEVGTGIFHTVRFLFRLGSEGRARDRAARKAQEDARASRQQQQEWLKAVEQQMARGRAGFATQAEAKAALRGKGGRPNKLDERKF